MAIYLNTNKALANFKALYSEKYFIDKSGIISLLNEKIATTSKYICITRPRRFGKSSIADMIGAYYTKYEDSSDIFDKLEIRTCESYTENLNKYNVISISFSDVDNNCRNCSEYVERITKLVLEDLYEAFPYMKIKEEYAIWEILSELNEQFIFIFDEWDYIFNKNLFQEDQDKFLEFLMKLLKDKPYVLLTYMTGVLPIKKYSSGSALNMFDEYTMLQDPVYGEFFGFTEDEVKTLSRRQNKITFEELSSWYNGYINEDGEKIYNPRSVVKALQNGKCISYWTNTGAMDEVTNYLKYNILEIKDEVIEMVSGEEIDVFIDEEFRAGQGNPRTRKEIYSAMIILGFLSYHDGYLKIPNRELMREFEKALRDESFGYTVDIIQNSRKMLKATLNEDTDTIVKILHDIHNSEIPILQYGYRKSDSLRSLDKFSQPNHRVGTSLENSLSCVITLSYLSARDIYRVEREEKTGKGYADFMFHPRRKGDAPFIVELKKDQSVDTAINQIKEKEYIQKFKNEYNEVLIVAICYDSKEKVHKCRIEKIKI